jgi:hypothetical protein
MHSKKLTNRLVIVLHRKPGLIFTPEASRLETSKFSQRYFTPLQTARLSCTKLYSFANKTKKKYYNLIRLLLLNLTRDLGF